MTRTRDSRPRSMIPGFAILGVAYCCKTDQMSRLFFVLLSLSCPYPEIGQLLDLREMLITVLRRVVRRVHGGQAIIFRIFKSCSPCPERHAQALYCVGPFCHPGSHNIGRGAGEDFHIYSSSLIVTEGITPIVPLSSATPERSRKTLPRGQQHHPSIVILSRYHRCDRC